MSAAKFYVTTPIYYVNAKPHIGTLYSTLLADVTARYQKLAAKEVFFLTGTDEHGQKIQEKAAEHNLAPLVFVDGMIDAFKNVWHHYEIEYNRFIRTTEPDHKLGVNKLITQLFNQDDIYKSTYTGWYCVPDETFVNIESVGDEIPNCPTCNRALRQIEEENYFFRLSAYQDKLLEFYEKHPDFITPKERLNEIISFVKSGLNDLSISRKGLKWGIPFPQDPDHAVYVWFDALTNYLTGIGYGKDDAKSIAQFNRFWPCDLHIMAKDIVRFHAVYWPAFLMAAQLPLPKKLLVHGYILVGDTKMSKSLGNVTDPMDLAAKYGVEPVRYYLMRQMAVTHDGNFDIADLEARIAGDLANNLGNLQSRTIALALSNKLDEVVSPKVWEVASEVLREKCAEATRAYNDNMTHGKYHTALAELWKFISLVNAYFNEQKPWELAKTNREYFTEVIAATCNALHAIAIMAWPIMPQKMESLLASLGIPFALGTDYDSILRDNHWKLSFALTKPTEPLFVRPEPSNDIMSDTKNITQPEEKKLAAQESSTPQISIDDLVKIELVVGTILSCDTLENSTKLYKLSVDMGSYGIRQILSGVREHFTPEDLIGKQGVVVANLPPRKMAGLVSQGMMLFAKDDTGLMKLTTVSGPLANGARLV